MEDDRIPKLSDKCRISTYALEQIIEDYTNKMKENHE